MAMTRAAETRVLSEAQRALVAPSHYPELAALPPDEVVLLATRLREEHDRLRGTVRDARRAKRGKAEAQGGPNEEHAAMKKQILAAALKRVARRMEINRG
ncbi:hypothetical protein [Sabulicella glaciei]|uniref:Uncharacterized protein n=1 Tax=Sabulicella glaciei TaxID=2984948 RepID=A0ABT3NVG4_9PROT|nr:hypothetical protein [Roseococcus sp. MDT2-1-1]MCW8086166.1 hypothetical protein [Roseococcus sp. MDT2-1-1]